MPNSNRPSKDSPAITANLRAGGFVADRLGIRAAYPVAGALRGIALAVALPVLVSALRAPDE